MKDEYTNPLTPVTNGLRNWVLNPAQPAKLAAPMEFANLCVQVENMELSAHLMSMTARRTQSKQSEWVSRLAIIGMLGLQMKHRFGVRVFENGVHITLDGWDVGTVNGTHIGLNKAKIEEAEALLNIPSLRVTQAAEFNEEDEHGKQEENSGSTPVAQ